MKKMIKIKNTKKLNDHWLYIGWKKIISRSDIVKAHVKEAKQKLGRAGRNKDNVADYLIQRKTNTITAIGALTGVVGVVPIVGGIGAVATSVTAEFIAVTQQEIELCLEIADNYGYDIKQDERLLEVLTIIGEKNEIMNLKMVTKMAACEIIEKISGRYARIGMLKALQKVALRLELKVGLKAFTKLVPVVGVGFGALINYKTLKNTGMLAKKYYGHICTL